MAAYTCLVSGDVMGEKRTLRYFQSAILRRKNLSDDGAFWYL